MEAMLPLLTIITILLPFSHQADDATGVVEIDDISFQKVLNKFDVSLVKFDVYFPYGEKHLEFLKLGKEAKYNDEILIAAVRINDFAKPKQNIKLGLKYGADPFELPVIKLFLKGIYQPITYNETLYPIEADNLRQFVRNNTKIYFESPTTLESFDNLAAKFINSDDKVRREINLEVGERLRVITNKAERTTGKIYKNFMESIINLDDRFVEKERTKLLRLLRDSVTKEKKKALMTKLHILDNFRTVPKTEEQEKKKKRKKKTKSKKKENKKSTEDVKNEL